MIALLSHILSRRRKRRRVRIDGSPDAATVNVAYDYTLDTRGGTAPYTVTLDSGALPDGLSLTDGAIEGTPTETGAFTFWLKVEDAQGVESFEHVELAVLP